MFVYAGMRFFVHIVCGPFWHDLDDVKCSFSAFRSTFSGKIMLHTLDGDISISEFMREMENADLEVKKVTFSH